jgi:hypothetical protein
MSGRRQSFKQFKGPVFSSFKDGSHSSTGRGRYNFKPGTQSTRQAKKNLRLKCRSIIDSKDAVVISVGDRVVRSVCDEPDPEYAALHLFCAALDMHDDTGEPWIVCMTYLMDKFDKNAPQTVAMRKESEITADGTVEESQRTERRQGSFLGRLLRSLVPRKVQARDEAATEADVDQSSRASAGEHGA